MIIIFTFFGGVVLLHWNRVQVDTSSFSCLSFADFFLFCSPCGHLLQISLEPLFVFMFQQNQFRIMCNSSGKQLSFDTTFVRDSTVPGWYSYCSPSHWPKRQPCLYSPFCVYVCARLICCVHHHHYTHNFDFQFVLRVFALHSLLLLLLPLCSDPLLLVTLPQS